MLIRKNRNSFIFLLLGTCLFQSVVPLALNPDRSTTFSGVKFPSPISNSLTAMGITTPTGIQKAAIAPLTSGLSAVLHAETGSGKTLAYILPLLKRIYGGTCTPHRVSLLKYDLIAFRR
jgi:superfamily II DNA/RNA helicase